MTTQENRVFAIEMHLICAEFELETRLAISGKIRVSMLVIQPICLNMG